MEPVEYVRCEGCGELHPMKDCEVVIVKITKGKNCALKPIMARAIPEERPVRVAPPEDRLREDTVIPDRNIPAPQDQPKVMPKKNIVPPHLLGMMIPPGAPGFESHGAKETRRV